MGTKLNSGLTLVNKYNQVVTSNLEWRDLAFSFMAEELDNYSFLLLSYLSGVPSW